MKSVSLTIGNFVFEQLVWFNKKNPVILPQEFGDIVKKILSAVFKIRYSVFNEKRGLG